MNATDNRKVSIINAAKRLFSEKGYAATGLREIAENAGVSIGNIYNYFSNKREIFNEILNPEAIIKSLSDISEFIQEGFPFNMNKVILRAKEVIDSQGELYRLIFIDLIEFQGYNSNKIVQRIIEFAEHVFNEKLQKGDPVVGNVIREMDYDFHIRAFTVFIISYFLSREILPSVSTGEYTDEEIADMISDLILRGVAL